MQQHNLIHLQILLDFVNQDRRGRMIKKKRNNKTAVVSFCVNLVLHDAFSSLSMENNEVSDRLEQLV